MGTARSIHLSALTLLLALSVAPRVALAQSVDQVAAQAKQGYVTDLAGVLSQSGKNQLTALCAEVQQKTQAQIAVVTIKSLNGDSIDGYAPDLFAKIGIGAKSTDRGVLILFSIDDHRYRTEVGYGLEPILPDGKVGTFGREAVPYLRQGNYDAAILLVTRRIADTIAADRGVTLTSPSTVPQLPQNVPGAPGIPLIFIIVVIFVIIGAIRRASRGGVGPRYGGGSGWWVGPMIGGMMGGGFRGGGFGGGGGGGFGGFGGGMSGGGGASGGW